MTTFENWSLLRGVQPLPAAPADVAKFIAEIAPLGIEQVWAAVGEISRAHYLIGLADPTLGGLVAAAINDLAKIDPPRSWPAEQRSNFARLPYDMQKYFAEQVRRQDAVVKAALQTAAEARNEAGLAKLPKSFYRNAGKVPNGDQSHSTA